MNYERIVFYNVGHWRQKSRRKSFYSSGPRSADADDDADHRRFLFRSPPAGSSSVRSFGSSKIRLQVSDYKFSSSSCATTHFQSTSFANSSLYLRNLIWILVMATMKCSATCSNDFKQQLSSNPRPCRSTNTAVPRGYSFSSARTQNSSIFP